LSNFSRVLVLNRTLIIINIFYSISSSNNVIRNYEFKYDQEYHNILLINWLTNCYLLPQSPLLWKGCLFWAKPPLGALSLKAQRKLLACLKWGPTVYISLIKSSIELIPILPRVYSIILLFDNGILCLLTFPYPLL
jgi:hypothetical protein